MKRLTATPSEHDAKTARLRIETVRGNLQGVQDALNQGVSLDQPFRTGEWNALMLACSLGHHHIVHHLLEQGANPNYHKELFTPLMASCASNIESEDKLVQCVQHLLQYNANIDALERHRLSSLMFACKQGHTKIVAELLAKKVQIDTQDSQGWTALFWAVSKGKVEIVELLVAAGADKEKKDRSGGTALQLAIRKGFHEIQEILQYGARKQKWDTKSESSGCQIDDNSNDSNSIDRNGDLHSSLSSNQLNKEIHNYLSLHEEEFRKFELKDSWPLEERELIKEFNFKDVLQHLNEDSNTLCHVSSMSLLADLVKQMKNIHLVMALLRCKYQNLGTDSSIENKLLVPPRMKCLSRIASWKAEQLYLETKYLYNHISKSEELEFCDVTADKSEGSTPVGEVSRIHSNLMTTVLVASACVIVFIWNTKAIGSFTLFHY